MTDASFQLKKGNPMPMDFKNETTSGPSVSRGHASDGGAGRLETDAVNAFVQQFLVAVDFQEPVPVASTTPLGDLPEWDSLAALGVIVMCDTEYGVTITGEDLRSCVTVGDIFAKVEAKKSA
jgi:acyl carrier protein